jgi:hypothetical protein
MPLTQRRTLTTAVEQAKQLLGSITDRIALDDFVEEQIEHVVRETSPEKFSATASPIAATTIRARIEAYEGIVGDLAATAALIGRWGMAENLPSLARILTRVGMVADQTNGSTIWLGLNWLPFFVIHYFAGVAAVSAGRYHVLRALYDAPAGSRLRSEDPATAVARAFDGMARTDLHDAFKTLPDLERRPAPRSEYLFSLTKRKLADVVRIGPELESAFDRFEIVDTLTTFSRQTTEKHVWVPPGRFAWKEHAYGGGPLTHMLSEAQLEGPRWSVTETGLFGGSHEKFIELATKYRSEYVSRLSRY